MTDKKKLEDFIDNGLSQRQIANELGLVQSAIGYQLKKYGLKTKNARTIDKYSTRAESKQAKRKRDIIHVQNRRRKQKEKAILYKGGKCVQCGYMKSNRVLSFHHINPSDKIMELTSTNIAGNKWETILRELDKCILVCANCHMEIHENMDSESR